MTEHQAKELTKFIIDHGNNQFTDIEKEIIKKAVDQASTPSELIQNLIISGMIRI